MNVLVCANCDHQMGDYNQSDWGLLCDECFEEYKLVLEMNEENEASTELQLAWERRFDE